MDVECLPGEFADQGVWREKTKEKTAKPRGGVTSIWYILTGGVNLVRIEKDRYLPGFKWGESPTEGKLIVKLGGSVIFVGNVSLILERKGFVLL